VNDSALRLPPIGWINEKLSENQRERRRLRTLLKLALEELDDRQAADKSRQKATGPEAVKR
jgi:hypothetical protein